MLALELFRPVKLSLLFVFVVGLISCNKDMIKGKGSISTRPLQLNNVTGVESHYDIKAVISYGQTQEISVYGYDNLLDILDFKVENGVLKLKYNTNYNTIRNGNVVAYIKMPVLNKLVIHGSKNIEVSGFANGNSLNATIHGSGNILVDNANYQAAILLMHGSGNIEAQGLVAKEAEATSHGSGHINISVADKLKANIFGSGNIYYWGNPLLESTRNGSGRVVKR